MVTKVGIQSEFSEALKDLLELDYDAIEAYEAAITRLDNQDYKENLRKFKEDHERHVKELSTLLGANGIEYPTTPSGKQWLTKGKVIIANIISDRAILMAMRDNENDTNTAYKRMCDRDDIWEDAKEILQRGKQDEHNHKEWLEKELSKE